MRKYNYYRADRFNNKDVRLIYLYDFDTSHMTGKNFSDMQRNFQIAPVQSSVIEYCANVNCTGALM